MALFSTVKVTTSVILVCLLQALGTKSAPIKGSEKKIICYYKISSYYKTKIIPENLDASLCTHIIYDFGSLNETTFKLDCSNRFLDIDQGFYERTTSLKVLNPDLKVLLGVGGWVDSTEKYSVLVSNEEKRANFINSSIPFLKQHGFDGLDINWQYPNCWQGICGCKPSDKPNFVIFLQELRTAYEPLGLTLSVSVAAAKWEIDEAYDVPGVSAAVDFINVMCYDFHGPWEDSTGHHSQFHPRPNDKYPSLNMKTAMNYYVQLGAEKKKLIAGIPSYGTTFTLQNTEHFGFGSSSKGGGKMGNVTKEGGMLSYFEICHYVNNHGWTEVEEGNTGTYAYKHDQWVGYDSPFAAANKARFITENDFGGVVIKSIDTDDYEGNCSSLTYPIIRALKYGFTNQLDEKCHDTKSLIICIKNEQNRELNKNSKNEMDTEDNMSEESEECSTPMMDTRQQHPQGTATPEYSQETTAAQQPQTTPAPYAQITETTVAENSGSQDVSVPPDSKDDTTEQEKPSKQYPLTPEQEPRGTTEQPHPQKKTDRQHPQRKTRPHHPRTTTKRHDTGVTPDPYAQTTETMVTESFHSQEKGVSAPSSNTKDNEQDEPSKHHAPTGQYPQDKTSHPYSQVTTAPDSQTTESSNSQDVSASSDGKKDTTEKEKHLNHHPDIGEDQYHPPGTTAEYYPHKTTAKYPLQYPTSQHQPQKTTPTPNLQSAKTTVSDGNKKPTSHPSRIPRSKKRSPRKKPIHRNNPVGQSPSQPLNSANGENEISNPKNGSQHS